MPRPDQIQPRSNVIALRSSVLLTGLLFASIAIAATASAQGPAGPAARPARGPATPFVKQHIYSETADPQAEVDAGLKLARKQHKRVLLDFGGDWCGDCQVLDMYFHQQPNADLLAKGFVLVHVFIGHMDKNLDLAKKYGVPIERGVPALSVLDEHGKPLFSQATGQFSSMRYMQTSSVTEFLNHWKPRA